MFMTKYHEVNNGYKYTLVCLDIFSKFAWAKHLKNKTANSTAIVFKTLLDNIKPVLLFSDKGTEFVGSDYA